MTVYQYKAINSHGKSVKGLLEADNPKALRANLKKEQIFVTEINESSAKENQFNFSLSQQRINKRVKVDEIAVLTRQLATLLKAGIPLVDSLSVLTDQTENGKLKVILGNVKQQVNEGRSLADSLKEYPEVFSNIFCNMIMAGESAGALEIVLTRLADFTENQARIMSKLKSAMMYPMVMIGIGAIVLGLLFTVVMPKITKIFTDMKATLPLITTILIGLSNFLVHWWFLVLPSTIALVYGTYHFLFKTEKGRLFFDTMILKTPLFGPLTRMAIISRFAKTLSTLIASGVELLKALDIVKNIVNNKVIEKVIENARQEIREGESIAVPLKKSKEFPPLVVHMIAVGEKSGQLEQMLNNISNAYDSQVDAKVSALTSLLEPLMIVFMGIVVGCIVFAILLPILQMNELIK